jgi:membrane protein implicated in regulation of membrane protease activity
MPRDERHPTPLLNMNPSGFPGLMAVVLMFVGMWSLFRGFFLIGLAFMSIVAVVSALAIRARRGKHPRDKSLLHLDSGPGNGKGTDG